jgi:hypothetical protein
MEELLENLLFSALFPRMDRWRRSRGTDPMVGYPGDDAARVFMRVELRLHQRYGTRELDKMVDALRLRDFVREHPLALLGLTGIALLPLMSKLCSQQQPN